MIIWAISDLHLSMARSDRRERFADRWRDHPARIESHWREAVAPGDLVLIPGDVSMARNHRELQPDLEWLERLPGRKVLSPGNHDRWWNDVTKVRPMLRRSMSAVDGDAVRIGDLVIAGARTAGFPRDDPSPADAAAMARASAAASAALDAADRLRTRDSEPLLLLWHHPPFDPFGRPGPWVECFERHGVTHCVYGHLHTQDQWSRAVQGLRGKVRYHCVAADAVGFRPLRIASI